MGVWFSLCILVLYLNYQKGGGRMFANDHLRQTPLNQPVKFINPVSLFSHIAIFILYLVNCDLIPAFSFNMAESS